MPPNLPRSLVLFATLAIAVAIAGCGGSSEDSASTASKPAATPGNAETTTAQTEKKEKPTARPQKQKAKGKPERQGKKSAQAEAEDLIRGAGHKKVVVDADSPVARKIIESLSKGSGRNGRKHADSPVQKAIGKILNPPQGGESDGGSAAQGGSVSEILGQLGK